MKSPTRCQRLTTAATLNYPARYSSG